MGTYRLTAHSFVAIRLIVGLNIFTPGTFRPLVAPSLCLGATAQSLRVINSVNPCVLKSNYYIKYVNLIEIGQVVIKIQGVENGNLSVPVNNICVPHGFLGH